MKDKVLLPIFYLPPISWFAAFLDDDKEVILEQYEHFPKQTYRNRTVIYGANGKLPLIIPIRHNEKEFRKIEMSFAENWVSQHWKSIQSAYKNSPYFEFYEPYFQSIYENDIKELMNFNLHALQVILKILKIDKEISLTSEFSKEGDFQDFRDQFSAKSESEIEMPVYYQTFSEKHGFVKDLSILDLICNLGPECVNYIKKIKINYL